MRRYYLYCPEWFCGGGNLSIGGNNAEYYLKAFTLCRLMGHRRARLFGYNGIRWPTDLTSKPQRGVFAEAARRFR